MNEEYSLRIYFNSLRDSSLDEINKELYENTLVVITEVIGGLEKHSSSIKNYDKLCEKLLEARRIFNDFYLQKELYDFTNILGNNKAKNKERFLTRVIAIRDPIIDKANSVLLHLASNSRVNRDKVATEASELADFIKLICINKGCKGDHIRKMTRVLGPVLTPVTT